uniref:non-specific protein-tyrosine kinase n=1 Tax=Strongyloides papillosus TaxID=174720 RepID=A0A0N5CEW1_STREA
MTKDKNSDVSPVKKLKKENDIVPRKQSSIFNQSPMPKNINKINPQSKEVNVTEDVKKPQQQNSYNLEQGKKNEVDNKEANLYIKSITPVKNPENFTIEVLKLADTMGNKKSNFKVESKENISKNNNVKGNLNKKTNGKIDMDKILHNIKEINKNTENKLTRNTKKITSKISKHENDITNKNNIPFYTFTKECQIYADLISPKTLIKIENYNNYGKRDLEKEPYYVGMMNNEMAFKVKIKDGEFFLRKVEIQCEDIFFISTLINNQLKHYLILKTTRNNLYYIKNYCFHTIQELIRFHLEQRVPIKEGVFLYSWIDTFLWQKQHNQIRLLRKIGGNSFSQVFLGIIEGGTFGQTLKVAVKLFSSTKDKLTSKQKCQFISDANIMINLKSKYIIKLICVCIQKEPLMAILEYASKGPLLKKLKTKNVTDYQKHTYCLHIALGIKYLHENNILHRDIAARNVLICDGDIAKLSDLGFVFHSSKKTKKNKKNFSLRWTAPETLKKGDYTLESEAWSYGIFMVEVFNNGEKPYLHIKNWKELADIILKGESKQNLNTKELPSDLHSIFEKCLDFSVKVRPSFDLIVSEIKIQKRTIKEIVIDWFNHLYCKFIGPLKKNNFSYEEALFKRRIDEHMANDKFDNSKDISMVSTY